MSSPPESPAWHALSPQETARRLGTGPAGLDDAVARDRFERGPRNELPPERPAPLPLVAIRQLRSPLIVLLLIAAAVTLFVGEYLDTIAIGLVVLLDIVIGVSQEYRAEKAVQALQQLVTPKTRVVRGGRERELPSAELVPGDLVLLESGVRVPADLRLVNSNALRIDESLLTGESMPVHKSSAAVDPDRMVADRLCVAYAGTVVASGRGRGYAITVGTATALGAIAAQIRQAPEIRTPLQDRMTRLANIIAVVVLLAAVAIFALGVSLGQPMHEMLTFAVAMAVSAIPEGLPVVLTITLAIGVRRMAGRNAVIRRLAAVETLGSTTVIGSDKTGTLTINQMTVQQVWAGGQSDTPPERRLPSVVPPPLGSALYDTLRCGVLASEASAVFDEDAEHSTGDPSEVALLVAARRFGLDPAALRTAHPLIVDLPFEPERRYSAALCQTERGRLLLVKGAPEVVANMSTRLAAGPSDGPTDRPMDGDAVAAVADAVAGQGLRVLAMACRELSDDDVVDLHAPHDLVFSGMVGMWDPPRPEVRDAIDACRRSGIRVVMITGDHAATAQAIAHELGISAQRVITGEDLERAGDAELAVLVHEADVFARVSPEHKLRIVLTLRELGEVVAVTGDGVNDAPALKAADIGIAMGRSGTDVAREAADMVLSDDNFVSIKAAVEEGRVTFDNVRKVTFFLLSTGAAEIIALFVVLGVGWPLLFLPAQLLWLNLVTNGLQDVALAFEPPEHGIADQPPRARSEGVMNRLLWERLLLVSLVMAAGTLLQFRWELDHDASLTQARTVALTTMVLFQAVHLGNVRSEHRSAFRHSPLSNPFLLLAQGGALGIHALALQLPAFQFFLRVESIPALTWARCAAVALSVILVGELHKALRSRRPGSRPA